MSTAPLNLALRFLLEMAALVGLGVWGWKSAGDGWRWLAVLAVPALAAIAWGTFAVPGDPSRLGAAPVPVPGTVRLVLELAVFAGGALAFAVSGYRTAGAVLAVLVVAHYAISFDRILWLLRS